jgi:hypothetical protein
MEWEGDVLGRKEDALFLTNYLTSMYEESRKKYFILNVNSPWGFGKTYFLKGWKNQLGKNHPVIYYDAWINDHTSEPLISFVATIEEQISIHLTGRNERTRVQEFADYAKKLVKPSLPIILSVLVKHLTGMSPEGFAKAIGDVSNDIGEVTERAADEALRDYNERKRSVDGFKEKLGNLVKAVDKTKGMQNPIFIFVDELDRCRPTFAIALLEAIKHLFEVDGLYFVIATDSTQLAHSIRAVYGSDFDSVKYLKRFFDREYTFDRPNYLAFVKATLSIYPLKGNVVFPEIQVENSAAYLMSKIFALYGAGLRDIEQCISHLQACSLTATDGEMLHGIYLLHLICLKHMHPAEFRKGPEHVRFDGAVYKADEKVGSFQSVDNFHGSKTIELSVVQVIGYYQSNLHHDLRKIASDFQTNNDLAMSIRNQIIDPIIKRPATQGPPPRHNMESYVEMVERSGRISG